MDHNAARQRRPGRRRHHLDTRPDERSVRLPRERLDHHHIDRGLGVERVDRIDQRKRGGARPRDGETSLEPVPTDLLDDLAVAAIDNGEMALRAKPERHQPIRVELDDELLATVLDQLEDIPPLFPRPEATVVLVRDVGNERDLVQEVLGVKLIRHQIIPVLGGSAAKIDALPADQEGSELRGRRRVIYGPGRLPIDQGIDDVARDSQYPWGEALRNRERPYRHRMGESRSQ
jgi:hypothetical protein